MSGNRTDEVFTQVAAGASPVGSVIAYGGLLDPNLPPPAGWLLCDGSAISRTTYAALFQVIGTLHGAGDGVSTFNLPDYRGRFQRGVDDGTGRDPDANTRTAASAGGATGDTVGSFQSRATALPTGKDAALVMDDPGGHTHKVKHLPTSKSYYKISGSNYAKWNSGSPDSSEAGEHTHTVNGGGDIDTCPVNLYVNHLIYYGTKS